MAGFNEIFKNTKAKISDRFFANSHQRDKVFLKILVLD